MDTSFRDGFQSVYGARVFGLVFILVGVNDLYSLLRCREKVDGVYCGYNTYYGGNGISTQSPIFEYTYNGTYYREQTAQNNIILIKSKTFIKSFKFYTLYLYKWVVITH